MYIMINDDKYRCELRSKVYPIAKSQFVSDYHGKET
jgi:hypothetical protein